MQPTTDIKLLSAGFSKACTPAGGKSAPGASKPPKKKKKKGTRTPAPRSASAAASKRSSQKVINQLWGDGKGRFRTLSRNSVAAVRGTIWLTQERCDGTLTRVRKGTVDVLDKRTRKTVRLTAGKSYLARATRAAIKTP